MYFTYVDWTLEKQPRPFYVGKGNAQRVKRLFRNSLHRHIATTHGMRREIVLETLIEAAAFKHEEQLIRELHTHVSEGSGANFTWGGEGASGRIVSFETRKAISEALMGHVVSEETRHKMSCAVNTWLNLPESRTKLSLAQKRRFENLNERANMAKFKGKHHTENAKFNIRLAQVGRKRSDETRRKQSEAATRHMMSDEVRQARSLALTGIKRSEATKQKLRDAWKRRKQKKACQEFTRLTEELGLYEWQQEKSGS